MLSILSITILLDEGTPATYSYTVSHEITYLPTHVGSLAVIKRSATLDQSRPLQNQLQLINLPGAPNASEPGQTGAYEFLHSYIHLAVSPYFDAYVNARYGKAANETSSKSKNEENKMGVPMAKKKMAELELSLLHLQQNVEIPEVSLNIHPVVQKAVDKVSQVSCFVHTLSHYDISSAVNKARELLSRQLILLSFLILRSLINFKVMSMFGLRKSKRLPKCPVILQVAQQSRKLTFGLVWKVLLKR